MPNKAQFVGTLGIGGGITVPRAVREMVGIDAGAIVQIEITATGTARTAPKTQTPEPKSRKKR